MEINNILNNVWDYLKTSAGDKWEAVKPQMQDYLDDAKTRLILVTTESMTGQLDSQFLINRVKDEIKIVESQAISLGVITASFTQEVVNTTVQNLLLALIELLSKKK